MKEIEMGIKMELNMGKYTLILLGNVGGENVI